MKEFLLAVLIIILLFWLSSEAHADRLVLNVGSHHVGDTNDLNEFNPGIGYEWEHETFIFGTGFYYNSYEKLSAYGTLGMEYKWVGGFIGVASGYEEESTSGVIPILAGYVNIPVTDKINTRILLAPGNGLVNDKGGSTAILGLQVFMDF